MLERSMIYLCRITDTDIDSFVLSRLPRERQGRIKSSLRKQKTLQLYISSMLCGYVLQKHGRSHDEVRRNAVGKPYIEGLHFNLSHSGAYVAMAVSDYEVGIDIQQKVAIAVVGAKVFFSDEEIRRASCSAFGLAQLWCRKEAFLKCTGNGWDGKAASRCPVFDDRIEFSGSTYCLTGFSGIDDYFLTVCEKSTEPTDFVIQEVSKHELERFYRDGNDPHE